MADRVIVKTEENERALDWLTALVPLFTISFVYYRWSAIALQLIAVGGYAAAGLGLTYRGFARPRLAASLVTGLLCAFLLPATTPLWVPALAGGIAAVAAVLPALVTKRWPDNAYAQPLFAPALLGYLIVWLVFPGAVDGFTLPMQWDTLNGATTATPLTYLTAGGEATPLLNLLFGTHAAAIGEGCVIAIAMAFAFLLLRRRVRLVAPAALLATVCLLSWPVFGAPVYSLLCGGVALGALLLADKAYTPPSCSIQAVMGTVAGVMIVLLRRLAHIDGTAVALLAVGLAQPAIPPALTFCRPYVRRLGNC